MRSRQAQIWIIAAIKAIPALGISENMEMSLIMETQTNSDKACWTIAALFLSATCPTANESEAGNAFKLIRSRIAAGKVDPHDIADRIRGSASFAPSSATPPAFLAMPLGVRRLWLDAIALRMRLTSWERQFLADVRGKALSTMDRLSTAQVRALQKLIDTAWNRGVRP